MKVLLLSFLLAPLLLAQAEDADKLVTVPQRYVSAEGLQHQSTAAASQWVGIGKEIGQATKEGLESVVDVSNKFGATQVGHFVMFMVFWRIVGRQLLGVLLGIPIWLSGIALWFYSMRRFFWGYQVLSKVNADKSKEYSTKQFKFESGDGRAACGILHGAFIIAWSVAFVLIIF
jgi:hypothetical protein